MYMSTWPLDATMEAKECRSPWSGLKFAGSPAAAWILLTGRLISFLWRPPRPGKTKCTFSRVSFQGFPRRLVHRDDLIWSAFWVSVTRLFTWGSLIRKGRGEESFFSTPKFTIRRSRAKVSFFVWGLFVEYPHSESVHVKGQDLVWLLGAEMGGDILPKPALVLGNPFQASRPSIPASNLRRAVVSAVQSSSIR